MNLSGHGKNISPYDSKKGDLKQINCSFYFLIRKKIVLRTLLHEKKNTVKFHETK